MKLTNETNWNTKQFKAFIRRVAEHECLNKAEIDKFNATLRYRKRTHARPDDFPGGYAYYKTWTFWRYSPSATNRLALFPTE